MGDLLDPLVMGLDVRLHRIDTQGVQPSRCGTQKRRHRLMLGNRLDVRGDVADEQALGDRLISLEPAVGVALADPGARRAGNDFIVG